MTVDAEAILNQMVRVIVDAVDPEQIILFGSHCRGEARETSDIDLLIVESRPFGLTRSRRKEMAKIWGLLADFPIPKDILLFSRDEVDLWRDSLNNVVALALREGRVLYD